MTNDERKHKLAEIGEKEYNDVITTGSGGVFLRQGGRFTRYSPTTAKYLGGLLIGTSDMARKGQQCPATCPPEERRNLGPYEVFATTTGVCLREGDCYENYSLEDAHDLGELLIRGGVEGERRAKIREMEIAEQVRYRSRKGGQRIRATAANPVEIPESDSGYVLIVHREGFKSTHVHFRYSREVVEAAKRRLEEREDVVRVVVEPAASYQERMDREPLERQAHDDWGGPIQVLRAPLITTLAELDEE
jgi:hypothetical protein